MNANGMPNRRSIPFSLPREVVMPNRVAVFIDGAYLEHVLKEEFGKPQIDFQALSEKLAGGSDILRSYYYHCPAYQSDPPTEEERKRYSGRRRFFEALERLPRYSVRLGRLARRGPDGQGAYRFEQKMVDILLGVDMVLLAAKHSIQEAVLIAGTATSYPQYQSPRRRACWSVYFTVPTLTLTSGGKLTRESR